MARIALLHSVEYYHTRSRPITGWDQVPFGLSLIAACLERAGHEVRCWVLCPDSAHDGHYADEIVRQFRCDMVAAGAVSTQFPRIAAFCRRIKELNPAIPIIAGGVHATVSPQDAIGHPAIDAICVGEGEDAAVAWANALARGAQPSGIPGLWIKIPGGSAIDRTPPAPFRTDLDELPFISCGYWERWVDPLDRTVRLVIGRGCLWACTYCSNHVLRHVQSGRYVRFRSPADILAELQMWLGRFPDTDFVYLEIETIGASIPWAIQLCDSLAAFNATRPRPIAFRANLAVTSQLVQHETQMHSLLAAFRRANLLTLNVGLESGSERIRTDILRRPAYSNQDLVLFCDAARQYGISVALYVLIGVPTETPAEAVLTSQVARACDPIEIEKSIFFPYRGTRLHEMAAAMQLFDPARLPVAAERSRVYLKLKDFPAWRVFFEYVFMTWRVFHGRRKMSWIVRKMLGTALKAVPTFSVASHRLKQSLVIHRRRPEAA